MTRPQYPSALEAEILDQYAMAGQLDAWEVLPEIRRALVGEGDYLAWQYGPAVYQRYLDRWKAAPLHMAAEGGYVEHLRTLIATQAADVDARDEDGRTALHRAVLGCEPDAAKTLIELHADIDATDMNGLTALHWAALTLEGDACIDLVVAGANPYVLDHDGETPMDHIYDPDLEETILAAHATAQAQRLNAQTQGAALAPHASARRL